MSMKRSMNNWKDYASHLDVDDVLELVGLARRRNAMGYALPIVGTLLVGAVIGAGIGLLLAPARGVELRRSAEKKVDDIKERIRSTTSTANNPGQNPGF